MKAEYTQFNNSNTWVVGEVGDLKFEAKLLDENSQYGINRGRVIKLAIWDEDIREECKCLEDACIIIYDREWCRKPKKNTKEYYDTVMDLLENSPMRFS
jgi:hypothetical protein